MTDTIVVVDYDPQWPQAFATIRQFLETALGDVAVVAIEHVGSTSVPGLAAKPIIDIDVIVERPHVDTVVAALETAGYTPLGDLGIVDRYAFTAPAGSIRQNTYVTIEDCVSVRNHLGLRNVLRNDTELRDEYAAVKGRVATRTDDIDVYLDGKTEIIRRILQRAGLDSSELDEIEEINRL